MRGKRRWVRLVLAGSGLVLLLASQLAMPASGRSRRGGGPIYRNRSYSSAERAADLVARMTLAEKASEMVSSQSRAIRRLGVLPYGWWNEAVHGVARLQLNPTPNTTMVNNTTSYPVNLALGSSWDPSLMYREASAISDEAREIVPGNALDLDFFSPTVNLAHDPRWARNDETYSEDPLLTAALASQYVDGMEGKDQNGHLLRQGGGYLKAIATPKHYAANNSDVNRITGSSNMDERALREYYTAQFKQIVAQSHPAAMMSAYNSVDGTPAAANVHLIDTLARQAFGFGGYFTSDCDAIDGIVAGHRWQPAGWGRPVNSTEAHAFANAAGEDLDCNVQFADSLTYQNLLPAATLQGIHTKSDTYNVQDLDNSLIRLFTARMQLGEFDNIGSQPWVRAARSRLRAHWANSDANNAATETPARLQLAREVAARSLVLLKNAGRLLPLRVPRTGPFKVAVIGALANPSHLYLGGYSSNQGSPGAAREVTPYQGIKNAIQAINPGAQVDFYNGFAGGSVASNLTSIDPAALAAAGSYDDAIVFVGTDGTTAREGLDRTNLALPGSQAELVNEVAARNPNTVAVMQTIGEVDVGAFQGSVPAMLWSSYDGQRQGDALADVLLGKYDPSAHLPFTWYQSARELPSITDYGLRPSSHSPGRTYMYFRGPVSYPFGYGLSYTTFRSSNLRVDHNGVSANGTVHVSVNVTNTGPVFGTDLVQLYVQSPSASAGGRPVKRLEGFRQVPLAPGQTRTVTLTVNVPDLAFFDAGRNRYTVDGGRYWFAIAGSAADGDVQLQRPVTVRGRISPVPGAVSVHPRMPGDGARGIQSRVMFPVGTVVSANPTVSMNDESLYGYRGRSLPRGMLVRYASDRPSVVSVARDGTIRTLRNGVATVTVNVAYRHTRRSTKFVLRVLSELDRLTVGSKPLPGFHPDAYSYDVIVPDGARVPPVSAGSGDRSARVQVIQPGGVPGAATVNVTGPDHITSTYKIYFGRQAHSDEFGRSVGRQWQWIRRDRANERLASGSLLITPEHGGLNGYNHSARNLLVQPALGDWTIQSKLTFSSPPHAETQQAGIIAYQGDNDFLKLDWEYSSGAARLTETTEDSLSGSPVTQVLTTLPTAGRLGTAVWLRMVKRGPHYTTYYSGNGRQFVPLYRVGASLRDVKVGLFAWGGSGTTNDLRVAFGYFHVRESGTRIGGAAQPSGRPGPKRSRRARSKLSHTGVKPAARAPGQSGTSAPR